LAVEKRPILIVHGAPEWMVTFGDMMSLLLTFFILLFSVAKVKDSGRIYDMLYAIQGTSAGSRPVHGYLLPNYDAIVDDLRNESESERRNFGERGIHSQRVLQSEGDGFYSLRVRDQLKITIEGKVLFEDGEWGLLDEGKRVLAKLLVPRFQDGPFRIVVRGHVAPGEAPGVDAEDDLGYRRAREVRDFFVRKGIDPQRFELQSMGSRAAPAGEDRDLAETRRRLRRVEIFVSPQAAGPPVEGPGKS
jgi:chemotaxis protein MotB